MTKCIIIVTIFLFGLTSCLNKSNQTLGKQISESPSNSTDTNLKLIEDFNKSTSLFQKDTFDLMDQSTEGGVMYAYHTNIKDYLVFDIFLFAEMGRLNATYWTDRKLKPMFVKWTNLEYDKPFYEKDYKTKQTIEYGSFFNNSFLRYDSLMRTISDTNDNTKRKDIENFLKIATKNVKIVK